MKITTLITLLIALAMLAGCVKEDEPKPTKKGAKWGIIYRDSSANDSVWIGRYEMEVAR